MPLHIIKLCVGCESLAELADWQKKRLKEKRAKGQKPELVHITRMTPKRAEEILGGGSLYWVIKGQIAARQTLLALRPLTRNGVPHCGLVYDKAAGAGGGAGPARLPGLALSGRQGRAARLSRTKGAKDLPEALQRELAALGLL